MWATQPKIILNTDKWPAASSWPPGPPKPSAAQVGNQAGGRPARRGAAAIEMSPTYATSRGNRAGPANTFQLAGEGGTAPSNAKANDAIDAKKNAKKNHEDSFKLDMAKV